MRWVVTALLVVLLSACSTESGGSRGEPVPRRSAADLATVRAQAGIIEATPTERQATPTPPPTREIPTPTAGVSRPDPGFVTDESLRPALIEPADLPMSWTLGDDQGLGFGSFCGSQSIELQFESLGWAYGSYSAAGGEWAEQWVIRLSEPEALSAMEYVRTSLTCDEETMSRVPGNDLHWVYAPLDLPPQGDDMHARRFDITFQNPVYTPQAGQVVFVRKGEFIVVVLHWGFNASPETTDVMVRVAIDRLNRVGSNQV